MAGERKKAVINGNPEAVDELLQRALNPASLDDLDEKRSKALAALLAQPTRKAAAEAAGISEKTLRSYMSEAEFSELLSRSTAQMVTDSQRRAAQLLEKGFDQIEDQLNDLLPYDAVVSIVRLLVDSVSKLG